jgi:hypothetical protein
MQMIIEQTEQGLTVALDGEPRPVESAEQACEIVMQVFGAEEAAPEAPEEAMAQGFQGVRGGSLG